MYSLTSSLLLAQAAASTATTAVSTSTSSPVLAFIQTILTILAIFVLPIFLGRLFAKWLRMPTHAGQIGVILASIIGSLVILGTMPLRYGPDIKGGTNLIYELDKKSAAQIKLDANTKSSGIRAAELVPRLMQRLNPSGTKEIVIRPSGDDQIEIIVPNIDQMEIDEIKRVIQNAGILQFRIVANQTDHQDIIQLAKKQASSENAAERLFREVRNTDGKAVGLWQAVGRDQKAREGIYPLKTYAMNDVVRDARTGRIIEGMPPSNEQYAYEKWLESKGVKDIEILLALERSGKPFEVVTGDDIASVNRSLGKNGMPEVDFKMKTTGAARLQSLTYANQPDPARKEFRRQMAIILDGRVLSAPNLNQPISSSGVITGNFTNEECEFLVNVLRSGSLPAALNKQPISENQVGAAMGQDAINKAYLACGLAMASTFIFILLYYRFSGFVACLALIINLLLILAGMIIIQQPITLPGLAGLVLSVGMSVDANVLVFERIREEIAKKSTGRLAIRNGFDRAMTTIIDSNLTTLITAVVLYWMGSDQVKGFAITLIIGLIVSMFTAVFCSRVFFEIAERWKLANFSMADFVAFLRKNILGEKDVDFMGLRYLCYGVSVVLISIGLIATFVRGKQILDIDFNGGTSVTFALNKGVPTDEVRKIIGEIFDKDENDLPIQTSLTSVTMKKFEPDSVYKLDTSLLDVKEVSNRLVNGFTVDRSGTSLVSYNVDASEPAPLKIDSAPISDKPEIEKTAEDLEKEKQASGSKQTLTFSTGNGLETAKINATALKEAIVKASKSSGTEINENQIRVFPIDSTDWTPESQIGYPQWDVELPVNPELSKKVIEALSNDLKSQPVWQSISRIEGRVAGQMQRDAIIALVMSMIFIVAYIWFRFQKVAYGLAAIIALVHDVLITLGFIAISHWLFQPLGVLLIEDFKISLTIVAAFLTIIGYSLNDTIVVFDRIREVKGKAPKLTSVMVNQSVNQTLGRTLLTSSTTIIAILLLYIFGGEGVHGFAYCLFIGIVVGTFSSIFVAAPILLWLADREHSGSRIGSA